MRKHYFRLVQSMLNITKIFRPLVLLAVFAGLMSLESCRVSYSFAGADVPTEAKTFSVEYFKVTAALASPTAPQKLTERLKDLIQGQTRLSLATSNGDLQYSGTITGYQVSPAAVTANERAGVNRLTMTVKVNYVNTFDEKKNFERDFSRFQDFDANKNLNEVEASLLDEINNQLVQDIFNASLGNW